MPPPLPSERTVNPLRLKACLAEFKRFYRQIFAGTRARFVAGALLTLLAFRYGLAGFRASVFASLSAMAAAAALAGCLWWVAKRQSGSGGALVALAFYSCTPMILQPDAGIFGALGVFAMLYTGVGVAHALQGPRRKWLPRILLMAALTAFTATAAPVACAAGLLLSATAAAYLAEGKRRILPPLFTLWTGVAVAALSATHHLLPSMAAVPHTQVFAAETRQYAGLLTALLVALALWCSAARTRYFGNTAPLLATLFLLALKPVAGQQVVTWALPFALLFAAGCFADALEAERQRLWASSLALLAAAQLFLSF